MSYLLIAIFCIVACSSNYARKPPQEVPANSDPTIQFPITPYQTTLVDSIKTLAKELAIHYGSPEERLAGSNFRSRLEYYLTSLNEMCLENPRRLSNMIEVGYQELERIGAKEGMLDLANDLHQIILTGHRQAKKTQINCGEYIAAYSFLRIQEGFSAIDATSGLMNTAARGNNNQPKKVVTTTVLNVRDQPSTSAKKPSENPFCGRI